MKARLPALSTASTSHTGSLRELITILKSLKSIDEYKVIALPETRPFFSRETTCSVSDYLIRVADIDRTKDEQNMLDGICTSLHAFILILCAIEQSDEPEKYGAELHSALKHVCNLCSKLTVKNYSATSIHDSLLSFVMSTGFSIFLTQIWTDFRFTMDECRILYYLLYLGIMPDGYRCQVLSVIESELILNKHIECMGSKGYYAALELCKGLTPRKYKSTHGLTTVVGKDLYPFIGEERIYDKLDKTFINCSKTTQVSFCYPNAETLPPRKISELQCKIIRSEHEMVLILCSFISEISVDLNHMMNEVAYEQKQAELKQKAAYAEKAAKERYRIKNSQSTGKEIVYVDRVVKDTEEVDMLRSKAEKYRSRISSLENTIREMEKKERDISALEAQNKMLLEYMAAEEENEETTEELSSEEIQLLAKMRAHLVVPDTHSLKHLRSILPNSNIIYIPTNSMFNQSVPTSYDVYLFCTSLCSHKSYYNWHNQVEDKNYILCATAGIRNICRALVNAYKQEA